MKKRKTLADHVEELDAMGKDSETEAAKWVIEKNRQLEKETTQKKQDEKQVLQDKRKFLSTPHKTDPYKENLLVLLKTAMIDNRDEVPKGYVWEARITDKGVVLGIQRPDKRVFLRGMKVSGFAEFDHQGISRLVFSALDQIQEWEQRKEAQRTRSGIYLPN